MGSTSDTHNGFGTVPAIDVNKYPAVKAHLNAHYPQLEKRGDKGKTPYNLRDCAYYEDFAKEKLLWIELVERGRFTYDDSGVFCANSAYILSGHSIKYLGALLNSTLVTWFMNNTALTSGMGATRWIKSFMETIPIPKLSSAKQRPFVRIVERILEAKTADPDADTGPVEWEIDRLVYDLYGLTEGEATAVERSLGLIHATDEEEDAALLRAMDEGDINDRVSLEEVLEILRAPDEC